MSGLRRTINCPMCNEALRWCRTMDGRGYDQGWELFCGCGYESYSAPTKKQVADYVRADERLVSVVRQ